MESIFNKDILKDKVVLVTGGGTGIGFGICKTFGLHGAKVAMTGRRKHVLDESVNKLKSLGIDAIGIQSDVRVFEKCVDSVTKTIQAFGKLDILVNNAAGNFMCNIENLTPNGFKTVMEIDLHGCFNMSKASLEALKESAASASIRGTSGIIISISATLQYRATPFQMHASAAKAGIDVMSRCMGVEWGEYGIRSVTIAPGPIEGTVGGPTGRVFGGGFRELTQENLNMLIPTGRFGTVDDVANTALFVCSSAGSYISATEIVVDGGHQHDTVGRYLKAKEIIQQKSSQEKSSHSGGIKKGSKL